MRWGIPVIQGGRSLPTGRTARVPGKRHDAAAEDAERPARSRMQQPARTALPNEAEMASWSASQFIEVVQSLTATNLSLQHRIEWFERNLSRNYTSATDARDARQKSPWLRTAWQDVSRGPTCSRSFLPCLPTLTRTSHCNVELVKYASFSGTVT